MPPPDDRYTTGISWGRHVVLPVYGGVSKRRKPKSRSQLHKTIGVSVWISPCISKNAFLIQFPHASNNAKFVSAVLINPARREVIKTITLKNYNRKICQQRGSPPYPNPDAPDPRKYTQISACRLLEPVRFPTQTQQKKTIEVIGPSVQYDKSCLFS